MSVIDCGEYIEGRQSSQGVLKKAAGLILRQRRYTRVFVVQTDDENDSGVLVSAASGIPQIGTPYMTSSEADAGAVVQSISPEQDSQNPNLWRVRVEYDSNPPVDFNENPFLRAPVWSFSFERVERATRYDIHGTPVLNSAKQPYDPPLTYNTIQPVIKITVNRTTFDFNYVASIQDGVNAAMWNGFDEQTVLAGLEVEQLVEGAYSGWKYNWNLRVKWDGHNPTRVIDAGWYSYQTVNGSGGGGRKLRQNRDAWGVPLAHMGLLDGNGGLLPEGHDPVELHFDFYRAIDFSGIPV